MISQKLLIVRHDLFIAKLHSSGLSLMPLRLLSEYLSNPKQQVKVENIFSEWENVETGVPQGPIILFVTYFEFLAILTLQAMQLTIPLTLSTKKQSMRPNDRKTTYPTFNLV